ncbi:FKBP-type peptidyl-prolyl cis-trans isomerase [Luteococcus peritonei]|uniref:peptidylprolyl isomerase n=1 Tax=Luteococcus peritonei TaxID=88874 RepID=A0ABW4RTP9_9ACTN
MHKTLNLTPRRIAGSLLALALAGSLTACGNDETEVSTSVSPAASASQQASQAASSPAASASPSAAATPTVKPTVVKNLDAVTVTPTTVGKAPTITAKWPIAIEKTAVKVLTPGTGQTVAKGSSVEVNYQGVNARTGKAFDGSFTDQFGHKQPASFSLQQVVPGFTKAIEGQKVGSRVLVMMTSEDGYADGNPQAGILKGDNLVFVIDILSAPYTKATGTAVAPKAGLPTVKDDAKGFPVVTVPKTAAPTTLTVQPLIKGASSRKVAATDAVTVNYRAYAWKDGKLLADDYPTGPETALLSQLQPSWQKGLVNQPVGSRVLIVSPPADAYGAAGNDKVPANTTAVFVVDVLYAQQGAQQ